MTTKFSIVIPTRSRATYLDASIRTALAAVDKAGCEAEVLISDNASEDNTAEVVAGFSHPALRYVRRPERYSMRRNFEACLDEVTGSHVIYIGDDDAILPHGLAVLRQVIADTGANIVNWVLPGYSWPDPEVNEPGFLKVFPVKLSGRLKKVDAEETLRQVFAGKFRSYHDGAVTYHGCISKEIVDRARAASKGTYFWCSSPDVFAAMHNLMIDGVDFRKLDLPITLGGASPRSNGRSGQRMSRQTGETHGAEFKKFIAESENDPFNGRLPTSCPSLSLITLDGLMLAAGFQGRDDRIDRSAWANRIAHEIASMTEDHRTSCKKWAAELLEHPLPDVPPRVVPANASVPDPANALKSWPVRGTLIGGRDMENVESAAEALDRICDMKRPWTGAPGVFACAAHTLGTAWRLRRAVTAAQSETP